MCGRFVGFRNIEQLKEYFPIDQAACDVTASYNIAPYAAGGYFAKIACFCFEMQVLAPGERVEMPVSFFVDPEMVDDAEAGGLNSITLSYTMHRADLPEAEVTALSPDAPPVATIR